MIQRAVLLVIVLVLALPWSATAQVRLGVLLAGLSGGSAPVNPSCAITSPTSASTYNTSVLSHSLGGTATAGSSTLDRVSVTLSGATTQAETNATGTATWVLPITINVGTTTALVKCYDTSARVGQTQLVFVATSPDPIPPTVSGGADDSTTGSSYTRSVSCTDDVGCTSVTWKTNLLPTETACEIISTLSTTVSATCVVQLQATGDLTTVNTVTFRGYDQSGQSGTDIVLLTRTVALEITTASFGSMTQNVASTGRTLAARGGTTGTYTFDNNGAGTTLNDADAECAGVRMPASWNGTSTQWDAQAAANRTPTALGTCSFTARVDDGVTTATQALTITIIAAGSDYFTTISALSEAQAITGCAATKGCRLDTMAELNALADAGTAEDYTIDATKGNAAKLTWPQETVSVGRNLRLPINQNTGSILAVWDVWYDLTWTRQSCGGVNPDDRPGLSHKEFQFGMTTSSGSGNGTITYEVRNQLVNAQVTSCDDVSYIDIRTYLGNPQSDADLAINNHSTFNAGADQTAGQGTPQYQGTFIKHGKWTRYWGLIEFQKAPGDFSTWNTKYGITVPAGVYHRITLWVGDETRDAARILYQAPLRLGPDAATVSSLTCAAGTATVTTATAHKISAGESLYVNGATQTGYNGIFTAATAPSTTQFTYPVTCDTSPATGTIKAGPARTHLLKFWFEHNTSSGHNKAAGSITVTGTDGTVIPKNHVVSNTDGDSFKTQCPTSGGCTSAGTIAGGTATITVQATAGGPNSNTAAGGVMTFSPTITGVTAATVATGGIIGGSYMRSGDMILWSRWVNVLKDYALDMSGSTSAADVTNNPTIFARPQ